MLSFQFTPFPELETERLLLRRMNPGDIEAIFRMRSDENVMKYIPRPIVTNREEAEQHLNLIDERIESNEGINWAITLKGKPEMLGIAGHYRLKAESFRSEIGYMLLPEYNGQGIITEVVAALVDYGFDNMGLHSIEAIIDPDNTASARVLEKNGFVKEAHLIENEYFEGKFLDTVIYSLLKRNRKLSI